MLAVSGLTKEVRDSMADEMSSDPPALLLARWGKDARLTPYGGGNFGTPPDLLDRHPDREPRGGPGTAHGDPLIVPTDRFFVRSNGPVPAIDPLVWRLHLGGLVERALTLSLADIQTMPQRRLTAFLECAGNGRTRYDPRPPGTPWRNDAVGNAVWEGVPLGHLLDLAGVGDQVVDIVAQGGDMPGMRRGLPLAVARDLNTLVVLRMNGEELATAHGGPVRLLVPGWAGIASTKWLIGLEVLDHAFAGFWNADNYVFWTAAGEPIAPVREMPVKSLILHPEDGARLAAGPHVVRGVAWSGHGAIAKVAVSTDGGASWAEASLSPGAGRRAWSGFVLSWRAEPGTTRILARAFDERGLTQPAKATWNAKGYLMNEIQVVEVEVVTRQ